MLDKELFPMLEYGFQLAKMLKLVFLHMRFTKVFKQIKL